MRALEFQLRDRRYLFPLRVLGPNPGDMTSFAATALLDTGATASGIGPAVIEALALHSHTKKRLLSATDEIFVPNYLFRIGFHTTEELQAIPQELPQWPYVFAEVEGFSWKRPSDFDVILGMDILSQCDVSLSRGGRCTLHFG